MRVLTGIVLVAATAIIAGSAALVMSKEDSPALSVRVEGVPSYVYYNQAYDLTIQYANDGGALAGLVELSVQMPETFALAEHIDDPARHGERLVWQLDGLDAGERGSVAIAVRGTLPEDLNEAVYDLPGYEGHTAFVEGFRLGAALEAGGASAGTQAVADTGVEVAERTIRIIKDADGADQEFDFNVSAPGNEPCEGPFTLNDAGDDDEVLVNCDVDEDYTVSETVPSGWALADINCSNDGDVDFSFSGNSVTITLNEDDASATCTFVNEEVDTGSITFIKDTNPETNDIFFDFDGDFGDFDLEDDDSITFDNLGPGDYTASENPAAGWHLVDIDCGSADYSVNLNTETVNIDLDEGENVTCTFVNEEDVDTGTIIIEKDVDPEPDGTNFSFSDDIPGCTIGTLDDDGGGGTPNSVTCTGVPAGEYRVTEDDPSPYVLVNIDCDDGGSSVGGRTAFIDLDPGETVRCVFTNRPPSAGSITIVKRTEPATTGPFFRYHSAELGSFDLIHNTSRTFTGLSSGSYAVSEDGRSGWVLARIDCGTGGLFTSGNAVIINLSHGQHVTCVFVNRPTADPAPTKTPAPAAPTATPGHVIVAPPSAGDGGLADPGSAGGVRWVVVVLTGVAGAATVVGYVRMLSRRA